MNKAAYYVTFDDLRKDAKVVVDGLKSYNDGQCLSRLRIRRLLIDLGEILSIHHITTYFENVGELGFFVGMYIPISFCVPYFCLVLLFLYVIMSAVSSTERKISVFLQRQCRYDTIQ